MVDKYYNGVIEQVYSHVGKDERNIVMVNYNNDFSIRGLEMIKRYSKEENNVHFSWHEFSYDTVPGAYEPFLDIICTMYRKCVNESFSEFLKKCGVYYLQQGILESYYNYGVCVREEEILLDEVEYEQEKMVDAICGMLKAIAEVEPIVVVINRFQMAAKSTMMVVQELLENPCRNIGIILGVNELRIRREGDGAIWESIKEHINDSSQLYHIGSTGIRRTEDAGDRQQFSDFEKDFVKIKNAIELMDYDLAKQFFASVDHRIKFEDFELDDSIKLLFYTSYAKTAILLGDMSKALELLEEVSRMHMLEQEKSLLFECEYLTANCYMYQGKLEKAQKYAKQAKKIAEECNNELAVFRAELLMIQAQMSGWHNIFFCVQDIPIEASLIERMIRHNYKNHLAYVYIFAYDNRPEMIARAYRSEAALVHFSKGVALAKEIGNEHLVYNAYQKNIMMASTNGMNEIAMLYLIRSYQFLKDKKLDYEGRSYSGIGYNLSALGHNEKAEQYYNVAIEKFYEKRQLEDIAEVFYNRALNRIMLGKYEAAVHDLQTAMKIIERLHLNSLRVCNMSKLYALLALSYILQGDRFNSERYLMSCKQFLNYIIEKEKDSENSEIIHDYAKSDDDLFLYAFSSALFAWAESDMEKAFTEYEEAEKYFANAEGNQYYVHEIYRRKRMELYECMGRMELYEQERLTLEQHNEVSVQIKNSVSMESIKELELDEGSTCCRITEAQIDELAKQEGLAKDYQTSKKQMEFISSWQKIIDVSGTGIEEMVQNAMTAFINHFSVDKVLYVWYAGEHPRTLYNDTGVTIDDEILKKLESIMKENSQGFATSKVSDSFLDHMDVIDLFDANDVCSFVAVPFYKNEKLTSLLITYVQMKDNWHSSIDRYMLNDDDRKIYQLLFREMNYSIKRMEANKKIIEMNHKLQAVAVTDLLTGIYNRTGLYEEIHRMAEVWKKENKAHPLGLMFIDLDNFKKYNDTFGHDVGDLILKEMAAVFTGVVEDKGFVSRYGGDEYIILLNTEDREELEDIAKEIYRRIDTSEGFRESIEKYMGREIEVQKENRITCSIGIAMASDVKSEDEVTEMIKLADDRLYSVKTSVKGRYAFI